MNPEKFQCAANLGERLTTQLLDEDELYAPQLHKDRKVIAKFICTKWDKVAGT